MNAVEVIWMLLIVLILLTVYTLYVTRRHYLLQLKVADQEKTIHRLHKALRHFMKR